MLPDAVTYCGSLYKGVKIETVRALQETVLSMLSEKLEMFIEIKHYLR